MTDSHDQITMTDWTRSKILFSKLVKNGRLKEARELLHDIFLATENSVIQDQASGALFVFDMVYPDVSD